MPPVMWKGNLATAVCLFADMLKEGWKEKAKGCREGVEVNSVEEPSVGCKMQDVWSLVSKQL